MIGRIQHADVHRVCGQSSAPVEVLEGGVVLQRLPAGSFEYPLPPHCRDGAEHVLELRAGGQPLQGSPIRVAAREEWARIPYALSDWTGGSVLVLAPHPDDETFGCGGSLLHHRARGDSARVVVLTDGEAAERRREEARRACAALGAEVEFWGSPDRRLEATDGLVERLASLLEQARPATVYCPSPWEHHPDHRAACQLLSRAAARVSLEARVLLYEIGHPLPVNSLVDISAVRAEKLRIGQLYASQLERYPYVELMDSLNRYRSHTVTGMATHCEGFYQLRLTELASRGPALGPLAPLAPTRVSIVVRTRNRPALLREALESLAAQTYANLEAVVVNDGQDDLRPILRELEDRLRLTCLPGPRPGNRAAAANAGLRQASGPLLGLLDDDDLLFPEHVAKLAGFLEATGEGFAYSDCERCEYEWTGRRFRESARESPFHGRAFDRDELYFANSIPSMTPLFRRDLLEAAGFLDESLEALEDWDLWLRMAAHASFRHLPGVTARYRVFGPRDYDFEKLTLALYARHSDYWSVEKLARATWPGLRALREQNRQLEAELQRRSRPWWKRLLRR